MGSGSANRRMSWTKRVGVRRALPAVAGFAVGIAFDFPVCLAVRFVARSAVCLASCFAACFAAAIIAGERSVPYTVQDGWVFCHQSGKIPVPQARSASTVFGTTCSFIAAITRGAMASEKARG